ncbi:AraC family transcriptional regulator [Sinorhizobium sp. A49]|jgi:AraC-like DNA-binding protein|nr:AraC family transcriptional regulator [Sinorhizobium sp. A49]
MSFDATSSLGSSPIDHFGLPRSRFDTTAMRQQDAHLMWRESIGVLFDTRLRGPSDEPFFASVDAALIGGVGVARTRSSGQDFDRSRYKIARDGMDGYLVQFYLNGQSGTRGSSDSIARPGDLYVIDMAQPLATSTIDHEHLSLVIPRQMLAPRLKRPDDNHELVLPASMPLVSLLRDTLGSLHKQLDHISVGDAEAVLSPLLDLAGAAINSQTSEGNAASVGHALSIAVRRYITDHLLEPDLTVERVMGAFGLSRRTVYRLLELVGGFSVFLAQQRLRRAFINLRAPEYRHVAIADLALAHGFTNAANFSRAFRREFGMSPRELRHLSAHHPALLKSAPGLSATDWSQWISLIGR